MVHVHAHTGQFYVVYFWHVYCTVGVIILTHYKFFLELIVDKTANLPLPCASY